MTKPQHDDAGAALILAIAFVVMIGAISAGLASLVTSSVRNRNTLEAVRNREYAADGAVEEAVTQVRASIGSPLTLCGSSGGFVLDNLNGIAIRVDWRNSCEVVRAADGRVIGQRNIIFSACDDLGAACLADAVIVRAQINFQQTSTAVVSKTSVQTWSVNR